MEDLEAPPRNLGFILQSAGTMQGIRTGEPWSGLHLQNAGNNDDGVRGYRLETQLGELIQQKHDKGQNQNTVNPNGEERRKNGEEGRRCGLCIAQAWE